MAAPSAHSTQKRNPAAHEPPVSCSPVASATSDPAMAARATKHPTRPTRRRSKGARLLPQSVRNSPAVFMSGGIIYIQRVLSSAGRKLATLTVETSPDTLLNVGQNLRRCRRGPKNHDG